jgi:transposase-like protein
LAQEYLQSGQSAAEFAQAVGVVEPTLERWLKESGRAVSGRPEKSAQPRLVPVMVGSELGSAEHIEVAFADGTALRAPVSIAPGQLEALLAAVRRSC